MMEVGTFAGASRRCQSRAVKPACSKKALEMDGKKYKERTPASTWVLHVRFEKLS